MGGQPVRQINAGKVRSGQARVAQKRQDQVFGQTVAGRLVDPGLQESDALHQGRQRLAGKRDLARAHGHVFADAAKEEAGKLFLVLDETARNRP